MIKLLVYSLNPSYNENLDQKIYKKWIMSI